MANHRYWRLYITASNSGANCKVGTMELRVAQDGAGANKAVPGNGTASANSESGGAAAAAFDGDIVTPWGNGGTGSPCWLAWDFGAGNSQDIKHLTIGNPTNADANAAPLTAQLQWSDDNVSWSPIIYVVGGTVAQGASTGYSLPVVGMSALLAPSSVCLGFSGAVGGIVSPAARIAASGGASASISSTRPTIVAYGGTTVSLTGPAPTLVAFGHDSTGENAAYLSAPRPTLSAYCGANATLSNPRPTLNITATVTNFGAAALRAPAGFVSAAGTVSGTAAAALNAPMTTLAGYSGVVCSLTLSGSPTVSASGTTGGVGGADIRGPSPRLVSSGTAQGYGFANLLAPAGRLGATVRAWLTAPSPMLTATGHAVVAATYEAYAINLNHTPKPGVEPVDEATRYSRFPFTHIVRHKDSYYGVAADGLYLLGGTTDNGVPTPYAVKTATTDFKSPYQKTVASAYLGGRLGPGATVTLHAGEGAQSQAYPYTTPRGALAQNYRQVFGKGIRHHRYYALGLSGTGVLELDNIELDTHQMTRRI